MARSRMPHVSARRVRRSLPPRHGRAASRRLAVLFAALVAAAARDPRDARAQALPNAGSILREQQQQSPAPPPPSDLRLNVTPAPEPVPASPAPGGIRFEVKGFDFTGNTLFSAAELMDVVRPAVGPDRSLDDLEAAADRVSAHYRRHGYLVARAYVPPQQIDHGIVRIAVSEGRYGRIDIDNESRTRDAVIARFFGGLKSGDVIDEHALTRATLLAQDAAGTTGANATIAPGVLPGTSDMTLRVPAVRPLSGSVQADNYGQTTTGTARLIGALQWNNPLGLGDQLGARLLGSITGQFYGNIGYTVPVGGSGLAWGVAYTRSTYSVGGQFDELDAYGSANVFSTFFSYPLLRSPSANVFTTLGYDHKLLSDHIGAFDSVSDKTSDVGRLGLSGNLTLEKSITTFDTSLQQGNLRFKSPQPEQLASQIAGAFTKFVLTLTHTQVIGAQTNGTQLYFALTAQASSHNLDSSEQISLGGPYAVRAYATGDAPVDEAYIATFEVRQTVRQSLVPVLVTLSGFIDTADGKIVAHPVVPGTNHVRLSGIGVGATFAAPHDFLLSMAYAHTLGYVPPTSGAGHANRFWVALTKSF
ncbi:MULTISPECIES: ShlB/FhaC/HecB family hemolysin secretion/activation protein [unclassified Caballeronia]|uniref:ShlB/FhaC/HecB family hemolysin secretion/activation protein n=1 Tax=unclassified Caballeronia TaxID=2646786 RepID=UPI001F1B79E5|nr:MULTISPECIES: ShlB/FhaC/HecB family hemolysin secretion/activation protein [unclassified Caballeronia]MCE4541691.1 ShlB/FhaC/HecB family hemolysin secretion/activation protein [Caballeronia sp. PC1]MCE4569265.1 ShlB/FhaC/HecB family hemolysin secretion/activation protein [Caballeronia sp. CLC5]